MFFFQSSLLRQSQQSTLLKQHPPWKMNLKFLRLPFSKSVAIKSIFANMHVCISVHATKMTAILEKVSILNFLFVIQFFQKVPLTEYLCHIFHITILETVAMNLGQEWQPSWKMVSILNFYCPLRFSNSGPSSLWTAPCRGGEACVLQWSWELCRRGFYIPGKFN